MTRAALAAADVYLESLAAFRFSAEHPVEPGELGSSAAAERMFRAIHGQRSEVYVHLAGHLPRVPDPFAAGVLALQLGAMVERGEDPRPLGDAMRERLPRDFADARRFAELLEGTYQAAEPDDASDEARLAGAALAPIAASAWTAQQLNTPAAMAAWCRHPPSRRAAARLPGLVEDAVFLCKHGGAAYYIAELLRSADGMELVVLAPEQRKGFVVELVAVRNAAHLFALLEDALVGDPSAGLLSGPRADPEIAAIARGERMLEGERIVSIGWHYEYWFGVHPPLGARVTGLHPMVAAMIGVEAAVADLPTVQGRAVVLMKPSFLASRTCEADFFAPLHSELRSAVHVRRGLSGEEVDAMMADLCAEAERRMTGPT